MKYALNLVEDGRILSVTYEQYASPGAILVDELPEDDITNYCYIDGNYVYSPLPKPGVNTAPIAFRNVITGEYITVNDILYKATANIPNGGEIIVGQNAEETTIEAQLYELTMKGE